MTWNVITGDVRDVLPTIPPKSVQCVVTSPPYMGLRDYGTATWEGGDPDCGHKVRTDSKIGSSTLGGGKGTTGHQQEGFRSSCPRCGAVRIDKQIGLEPTLAEYITGMVEVFRLVRDVLADDGCVFLNVGDSYNTSGTRQGDRGGSVKADGVVMNHRKFYGKKQGTLKDKDLMMVPARLAIALQDDGWYLRSDIIWHKPNPMPESVTDRPTSSHEHIFLLTKSSRYFYDSDAIREPQQSLGERHEGKSGYREGHPSKGGISERKLHPLGANARNVWSIATAPYSGAHFATFPPEIPRRCILAGSRPGDTVLDPFAGAGTTLLVADRLDRNAIGVELNPTYADMARKRIYNDAPLFQEVPA